MAAGFPHVHITTENRHLAYECCLVYEVITKRVAAMDDIRKGLSDVRVLGVTLLDLLTKFPELQNRVFPANGHKLSLKSLRMHLEYAEHHGDIKCMKALEWFQQYIADLDSTAGERHLPV